MLVVDGDARAREHLTSALQGASYRVVAAPGTAEGQRLMRERAIDVVVASLEMEGNRQLQWIESMAEERSSAAVIAVTERPSLDTAIAAVRLPVVAYLTKPVDAEDLLTTVKEVTHRRRPGKADVDGRVDLLGSELQLTKREREALRHIAQGASNKDIAAALGCALRTVELHVTNLLRKSSCATRAELQSHFWRSL